MSTEEPQTEHQESMSDIIMEGDRETIQMLLGEKTKIRPAGVLSPGIMVPRANCTPAERAIYDRMVKDGASWNEIEKAMGGDPMDKKKSKLNPKNVDYFTVLASDFERTSDAEAVKKYADTSDGKLRTIPIWLPTGELDLVIRHGYSGFYGRVFRFRSFYDTKGEHGPKGALTCRYLPKPKDEPQTVEYRPCVKEDCPDAKAKRCEFRGVFKVAVPGVSGMGEVVLYSKSIYGFSYSMAHLKQIRSPGVLGRIHGLVDGKPFLCLRKVQEDIVHDGKPGTQFIPVIEALMSTFELAQFNEPARAAARASAALAMLRGPAPSPVAAARPQPPTTPSAASGTPGPDPDAVLDAAHADAMREASAVLDKKGPAPGEVTPEVEKAVAALKTLCEHAKVNLPWEHVAAWIVREWAVKVPELATVEQLRAAYGAIRTKVTADREEFVAYLADCHREASAPAQGDLFGDDLPEFD